MAGGSVLAGIGCCLVVGVAVAIVVGVVVTRQLDASPFGGNNNNTNTQNGDPTGSNNNSTTGCNGLDNLCQVRVNAIQFPTLHNAISTLEDGTSFLYNHAFSLEQALEAGWRGINFDVGKCNGQVALVHGDCQFLGTRDPLQVLGNIVSFLRNQQPNDVIIIPIQFDFDTGGEVTLSEFWNLTSQVEGFNDLLYQHPGRGAPWPTLQTLIDADTRILLFHYNGDRCAGSTDCPSPALHDWFDYAMESAFEFDSLEALTADSCAATRGLNGERDFLGVNLFTRLTVPETCAQINAADVVASHLQVCASANGNKSPNLIIADCWDVGDILSVARDYNSQLPTADTKEATVSLALTGIATEMQAPEQAVFVATCSQYFASQYTTLSNVGCSVASQSLETLERRTMQAGRQLQTNTLQVEVQVSGDVVAGQNGDTDWFTTDTLETTVGMSGTNLATSLASSGNSYYASIENVVYVRISGNEESSKSSFSTEQSPPSQTPFKAPANGATETMNESPAAKTPSPSPVKAPVNGATETFTGSNNTGSLLCNGLENLCDVNVNNILFATVHNAPSTVDDGFSLVPNHRSNFTGALKAGYRGINFDIGKCDGQLQLVHGYCLLGQVDFVTAFSKIVSFLNANPHEVLIMPTEIANEAGGGSVTLDEIDQVLQSVSGFKELMYQHPGPGTQWPTLRELIEANTRILFFHYNGDEKCGGSSAVACPTGFHDWFDYAGESQFEFLEMSQFNDPSFSCQVTRGPPTGQTTDFYGVNVYLQIPSFSSCGLLNERDFLEPHLAACITFTGHNVNLLIVDCWEEGDVLDVVRGYNAAL